MFSSGQWPGLPGELCKQWAIQCCQPVFYLMSVPFTCHWRHLYWGQGKWWGCLTCDACGRKDRVSVDQEIVSVWWNAKVYNLDSLQQTTSIQSQMNPVHAFPSCFFGTITILFSQLRLGLPNGLLSFRFPRQYPVCITYRILARKPKRKKAIWKT